MTQSYATSIEAGFTMPISWPDAVHAAAVRTLPAMGGVSAVPGACGPKRRVADTAQVCLLTGNTDVLALEGAFPGTSAWSPPI